MDDADYVKHDGLGLAALVAGGQTTAAELYEAAQRRAAALNPRINAIVRPMTDEAEARLREPLGGPFAGVPFLIKDLGQEYAGLPSTAGSRALVNARAPEHSTIVRRWLNAGLVIFGKTNTPEFGAKGITEPVLFGPTRNPWDLDAHAGRLLRRLGGRGRRRHRARSPGPATAAARSASRPRAAGCSA